MSASPCATAAKRAARTLAPAALTHRPLRAPAAFICLLALLVTAAPLYAQSGRNRTAPPPEAGKTAEAARPSVNTIEGPIAEPEKPTGPAVVIPRSTGRPLPARPKNQPDESSDAPDGDEVVRVKTTLIPLPVAVTDSEGRAVTNLRLEDFNLLVDGEPRPLAELSRNEAPANIALLFDNSYSLNATRAFQKEAAVGFLRNVLRPSDRAAVYSISTAPELVMRLTGDTDVLANAVANFPKPQGATALFDALAEAAEYLGTEPGRRVLVVVSDGTDTSSELGFDAAMSALLRNHVQVYVLRIGHSDNANLRDLAGERRFQQFAAQTGGEVFVPRTREDFRRAFTRIATELAEQYVLSYYPSEADRAARFRSFTLKVKDRPALRVRTRRGYHPPRG